MGSAVGLVAFATFGFGFAFASDLGLGLGVAFALAGTASSFFTVGFNITLPTLANAVTTAVVIAVTIRDFAIVQIIGRATDDEG